MVSIRYKPLGVRGEDHYLWLLGFTPGIYLRRKSHQWEELAGPGN